MGSSAEYQREWRRKNPTKQAEYNRRWREKVGFDNRTFLLQQRYGITPDEYDAMLAAQGGRCAVCRTMECSTGRSLAVDHDHDTGKIRGLLCSPCNTGIGMFKDKTDLLRAAIEYLS